MIVTLLAPAPRILLQLVDYFVVANSAQGWRYRIGILVV